jgi:hypothetical protein
MTGVRNVCKRQLILGLLILGTTFCVPVSVLAAGVITVNSPANGATVTVPFDVNFTYGATATYTKLWIDGVAIISEHNGSAFDYTVTSLAVGSHTLTLQAHDAGSNTTISVHETITVSSTPPPPPPTVTVTPPSQTILEGNSYTFNSNVSANWSVSGDGTIPTCTTAATSCVFVAGATPGPAMLTAKSAADSTQSAGATITVSAPAVAGSTAVLTSHNDQFRSGANTAEVLLNTTNVNQNNFGLKYSYAVDGQIYAQPLYMPNVPINGGATHNVVFVATENNTVYAFDADGLSPSALWSRSLGKPHPVSGSSTGTPIYPSVGITGTPVIDPATNTMYVLAVTTSGYQLNALDVTSGQPRTGSPATLTASVNGTGLGSSNGVLSFPHGCYQRPGLALTSGNVYIGFSFCHQGWLFAYDASTLQRKAVFCATPNGKGGGIWMGGGAPAVDSDGYIYVITSDNDGDPESIYEDAFMKFNPDLTVADYFQTSIDPTLIKNDADQGSGGVMILPDNSSTGAPHQLIGGGKDGYMIVLNRDNLGKEHASDLAIQEIKTGVGKYSNIFSSPAFWNGTVYYHPENDTLHLFNYNSGTGLLATSPAKSGSAVYGWHGATPSISANGNSDGIVWEIEQTAWKTGGPAVLHAYDALSATELYNSSQAGKRDTAGPAVRFTVPTVADGKVFVGTANQLDIYGLL